MCGHHRAGCHCCACLQAALQQLSVPPEQQHNPSASGSTATPTNDIGMLRALKCLPVLVNHLHWEVVVRCEERGRGRMWRGVCTAGLPKPAAQLLQGQGAAAGRVTRVGSSGCAQHGVQQRGWQLIGVSARVAALPCLQAGAPATRLKRRKRLIGEGGSTRSGTNISATCNSNIGLSAAVSSSCECCGRC